MTYVSETAHRLRRTAEAGPIGKRHSSFELYDLLQQCMIFAEACAANGGLQELRELITNRTDDHYVFSRSNEYDLVCRFVFGELRRSGDARSNASRYAITMKQARDRGVAAKDLSAHLRENGGINALFLKRPLTRCSVTTSALRLASPITVFKGVEFTLTLKRNEDNTYAVLNLMEGK